MRLPPPGTIQWGRNPAAPSPAGLADDQAAYQLKRIPLNVDRALLSHGQQVYNTYCAVCHGGAGTGNGVTTQYNMSQPANYHIDRLRQESDGYFYKVITEGRGLMGAYGPSIRPADRWAVVAYVRALQRSENATINDVPEELRKELEDAK
jgi:mono/diheme cytochrome c family protein